jgi:glycosyltransferase involved in cell wall biosynthesis
VGTKAPVRVSIVTPTLNQARFLERTLESVRNQTYPAAEHIVIDGGSTDGTIEILRREGDRGTIRWTSGPDDGMYDAVNNGLAMTSGNVLAYLASDDAYLPWTIETVAAAFEARPDVDLVFGDGITVEQDSGIQILRLYPPFDRVSLASYASLLQPAVFWRRHLSERLGGFDARMRYVADLDFWLRAAGSGATIAHLDEVLALERVHPERLSTAQRAAMQAEETDMRASHAGPGFGDARRRRAAARYLRWQRWLWVRFLLASTLGPLPGPWRRFLAEGDVRVRPRAVLSGLRPGRHNRLRKAMSSRLAARILAT